MLFEFLNFFNFELWPRQKKKKNSMRDDFLKEKRKGLNHVFYLRVYDNMVRMCFLKNNFLCF
jgi:hypothetical protein